MRLYALPADQRLWSRLETGLTMPACCHRSICAEPIQSDGHLRAVNAYCFHAPSLFVPAYHLHLRRAATTHGRSIGHHRYQPGPLRHGDGLQVPRRIPVAQIWVCAPCRYGNRTVRGRR